jgi:hypothetical protein
VVAAGCAKGNSSTADAPPPPIDGCGDLCDTDGDGVVDGDDACPGTPPGEVVNDVGCSDGQVAPELEPTFPPFGLEWMEAGDIGRAGGLTWTYNNIDRGDLFHIYWVICDDPATPCGVSLDGPIDAPNENWQHDAAASNLTGGVAVFFNSTSILLADSTTVPLEGRLTVSIVDGAQASFPFDAVENLDILARRATHGAEIPAAAFVVTALIEVRETAGPGPWMPYLDYYDAAPTGAGSTGVSFGGSFYSE